MQILPLEIKKNSNNEIELTQTINGQTQVVLISAVISEPIGKEIVNLSKTTRAKKTIRASKA